MNMKKLKFVLKLLISLKLILLIVVVDSTLFAQGQSDRANQARQDRSENVDTLRERGDQARTSADTVRSRGETMRQQSGEQRNRGQEISGEARQDGRAFGQRVAEQARQQRMERAAELGSVESEGRIRADEARERIENARRNLENARNEGRLTEQEFNERISRVDTAREKLEELEEKLNRGREMRRAALESVP
jgi:hypothetical protein